MLIIHCETFTVNNGFMILLLSLAKFDFVQPLRFQFPLKIKLEKLFLKNFEGRLFLRMFCRRWGSTEPPKISNFTTVWAIKSVSINILTLSLTLTCFHRFWSFKLDLLMRFNFWNEMKRSFFKPFFINQKLLPMSFLFESVRLLNDFLIPSDNKHKTKERVLVKH